jgi:hypothetical protein
MTCMQSDIKIGSGIQKLIFRVRHRRHGDPISLLYETRLTKIVVNSSVSTPTDYMLNDRYSISVRIKYLSLLHYPQLDIGGPSNFLPNGYSGHFPTTGTKRLHNAEFRNEWSFTPQLRRHTGNFTLHVTIILNKQTK